MEYGALFGKALEGLGDSFGSTKSSNELPTGMQPMFGQDPAAPQQPQQPRQPTMSGKAGKEMATGFMSAGYGGMSNPGYQDVSKYSDSQLQGLVGLLMSGALGGQNDRKRIR